MLRYKKVCQSCMVASHRHTDVCVNGCGGSFMTIDDFMDQGGIRNDNDTLLYNLELLVAQIKSEIDEFDKAWSNTWDTEFDVQVDIPSVDEMVQYKNLVELP